MAGTRGRSSDPNARWHIVVSIERDGHPGLVLSFDHTPVTIGGAPASDVVLSSPYVSRAHSTVVISGGYLVYRDRSSNGSFLNGVRIQEAQIEPTDVIVIPPYRLHFRLEVGHDRFTLLLPPDQPPPWSVAAPPPPVDDQSTILLEPQEAEPPPQPKAFELQLIEAPAELSKRTFRFDRRFAEGDVISVGRASDADVCLDLQSVSRRHAVLVLGADRRWHAKDLGSRNGITINGKTVNAAALADGDQIAFGPDVVAVFRQARPGEASRAPTPAPAAVRPTPVTPTLSMSSRRSSINDAVAIVSVAGRVDGYNYAEFRDQINRALDRGERLLILDFTHCPFCDHAGFGVVLSTKTGLEQRSGRLCLIGLNQMLIEGIALLGLSSMLPIEPDEAAAVRRLVKA